VLEAVTTHLEIEETWFDVRSQEKVRRVMAVVRAQRLAGRSQRASASDHPTVALLESEASDKAPEFSRPHEALSIINGLLCELDCAINSRLTCRASALAGKNLWEVR
jgi:hypothetical protein